MMPPASGLPYQHAEFSHTEKKYWFKQVEPPLCIVQ